uniref:(northern house mosquito) hypothetical protein n=1 Tax=Culex pipiens TaxID=7175 RepID=A0A8D8FLS1_CULPI
MSVIILQSCLKCVVARVSVSASSAACSPSGSRSECARLVPASNSAAVPASSGIPCSPGSSSECCSADRSQCLAALPANLDRSSSVQMKSLPETASLELLRDVNQQNLQDQLLLRDDFRLATKIIFLSTNHLQRNRTLHRNQLPQHLYDRNKISLF